MGGLYNMVFGKNPISQLAGGIVIARQHCDFGRYRDAWVENDGDVVIIRIHTRNGGGNREAYEAEIESMRDHPWYARDEDDEFDSTYADFYFVVDVPWVRDSLPDVDPELRAAVADALVAGATDHVNMTERWQAAIEAIGKPQEGTT